ncbi:MAG: hypothetical protein PHQ72_10380 [Hespellia sp.]|nr:hypothetical protein [Hespellia sp.]
MMIGILITELLTALILFGIGMYFYKSKETDRNILFLTGNYSGLDAHKICRVTGKRFMIWAIPFLLGAVIDFFDSAMSIKITLALFGVLFLFHLFDMNINKNKKYK